MNRRAIAVRLSLLVALAGVVPIATTGLIGIEVLRRRSIQGSEDTLREVAKQATSQLATYLEHRQETLRVAAALANGPTAKDRLAQMVLDVQGLEEVALIGPSTAGGASYPFDDRLVDRARSEKEARSEVFLSDEGTPVIDLCVLAAIKDHVVCERIDLMDLSRFVRRMRVGQSGYVLVFDSQGQLWASGLGDLLEVILNGDQIPQGKLAKAALAGGPPATVPYERADKELVLAGWETMSHPNWVVAVEQPLREALQPMRAARWLLIGVLLFTLVASLLVGLTQSQRVLRELEIEERWRTAGRIAAGINHDLGHRLRVLQQTAGLAEAQDPAFLARIAENLRAEVGSLQKFIADFSDLSRDVRALELVPLELGAFLESVRRTAIPHAEACGVTVEVDRPPAPIWTRADRHLLGRAAMNLISNAIEASPQGGVVRLAARAGARAVLEVSDRGPGIGAERLRSLFDAFVSTKKTGAHLGIGLANVKRIVEAHQGQVQAESEEGSGARFRIELPIWAPPEELSSAA